MTTSETIAEIVECMRGRGEDTRMDAALWRRYADRIEAAWKREKAQPGDAAAMRKVLATLRNRFNNNVMAYQDRYFKFSGWHWHKKAAEAARWRDVFQELKEVCDAALAAPPRNCDTPYNDQAEMYYAFKDWCKAKGHTMEPMLAYDAFDWLLASAAERKGGDSR